MLYYIRSIMASWTEGNNKGFQLFTNDPLSHPYPAISFIMWLLRQQPVNHERGKQKASQVFVTLDCITFGELTHDSEEEDKQWTRG